MTDISAAMVRELREATQAGIMDAKRALQETGGDFDEAVKILRERGMASAAKRVGRETTEGVVLTLTDDVHGSMGLTVAQGTFKNIDPNPDNAADICTTGALNLFGVAPQVTTRNAPTTVNGVAFFRQMFWDGRGNDNFNGASPFGQTANNTAAQKASAAFSTAGIGNSALASQAVGPANKFPEVSCNGRTFGNLYDKLMARKALQHQFVHQQDSALGAMSAWPAKGLKCGTDGHACGYGELIAAAFGPSLAVKGQFSRVFGQAVQAYESTLIPDQTPLDRLMAGNSKAMTDRS